MATIMCGRWDLAAPAACAECCGQECMLKDCTGNSHLMISQLQRGCHELVRSQTAVFQRQVAYLDDTMLHDHPLANVLASMLPCPGRQSLATSSSHMLRSLLNPSPGFWLPSHDLSCLHRCCIFRMLPQLPAALYTLDLALLAGCCGGQDGTQVWLPHLRWQNPLPM